MTGLSGLTTGAVYFLSASASGVATTTEPSVVGQISKPLYVATSPTTAIILNSRGTTVGGTNLTTTIGLTLATSTVIQNVSAWPEGGGGKINGTITVLGPSPIQGCRVEINFQKLSSTVYNISAAFPSSSIIAASGALAATVNETNGNISITLPTITSATSASITFSIDASSVGTTLPLAIDAGLVLGSTSGVAPASGHIGEVKRSTAFTKRSTATTLASLTPASIDVLNLPAGNWAIYCSGAIVCTSASAYKYVALAVSGTNNVIPAADTESVPTNGEVIQILSTASNSIAANYSVDLVCPPVFISLASTTTFYAVINCEFTGGTIKGFGNLYAVRM